MSDNLVLIQTTFGSTKNIQVVANWYSPEQRWSLSVFDTADVVSEEYIKHPLHGHVEFVNKPKDLDPMDKIMVYGQFFLLCERVARIEAYRHGSVRLYREGLFSQFERHRPILGYNITYTHLDFPSLKMRKKDVRSENSTDPDVFKVEIVSEDETSGLVGVRFGVFPFSDDCQELARFLSNPLAWEQTK